MNAFMQEALEQAGNLTQGNGVVLLVQHTNTGGAVDIFGGMLRERRKELRLGLREFALRADVDAGNLSKIERGKLNPPQTREILDRICLALEYDTRSQEAVALRDQAAAENGRVPEEIVSDADVLSKMPVLLRTVHNKQLSPDQLDKLIEMIRDA